MVGCRLNLVSQCLALLLACWCIDAARAQAYGPWRIPSTSAQFFGYGFGAGHHAPIVRTLGGCPPRVARMVFVPASHNFMTSAGAFESFNEAIRHPVGCSHGQCAPVQYHSQVPLQPIHQQRTFSAPVRPAEVSDVKVQEPVAKKQAQPSLPGKTTKSRKPAKQKNLPQSQSTSPVEKANKVFPGPPMPTVDPLKKLDIQALLIGKCS